MAFATSRINIWGILKIGGPANERLSTKRLIVDNLGVSFFEKLHVVLTRIHLMVVDVPTNGNSISRMKATFVILGPAPEHNEGFPGNFVPII